MITRYKYKRKILFTIPILFLFGCAGSQINFDWLAALQSASRMGTRMVLDNNPYWEQEIKNGVETGMQLAQGEAVDVAKAGRMILDFVEKITNTASMPAVPQLDRKDLIDVARKILDALQDVISIQLNTPAKLERAREIVRAVLMGAKEALQG